MELKDCRFLIVDDHALLRQMVGQALKEVGVDSIEWASNGTAGLEKIRTAYESDDPYHIVFIDWSMPGMNGYDLLVACRNDKRLDAMAMVMLTAESEDINIIKALEAGATAYVTKPFKPEVLLGKMEDVMKWRTNAAADGA